MYLSPRSHSIVTTQFLGIASLNLAHENTAIKKEIIATINSLEGLKEKIQEESLVFYNALFN